MLNSHVSLFLLYEFLYFASSSPRWNRPSQSNTYFTRIKRLNLPRNLPSNSGPLGFPFIPQSRVDEVGLQDE